jgi:hypothetical protein
VEVELELELELEHPEPSFFFFFEKLIPSRGDEVDSAQRCS